MKKLALLLLPALMFAFTSCSDDDDLPQVSIDTTYTGATMVDGTLYVVQDQEFAITSVVATPLREGKKAGITAVDYLLDGWNIGYTAVSPFAITFEAGTFTLGKHLLSMSMIIAEEGCSLATGYYATDMVVVATADEIPTPDPDTEQGVLRITPTIQQ